ncbi:hypothetical protein FMEXI_666 [Fusarium mexicanum]|uniref:Uncharacterized protein n=1 Tax=Fusarium mexicanum TaxID=751941 RepID=A0A8H5JLN4_9HYPO|nr:hypothetical protein FMEXI_666 [Fusarium mexicanum]
MASSQPTVAAVDPPPGWPPYRSYLGQNYKWITAYNTYVNAWTTWASKDPNEDENKWIKALNHVYATKASLSRDITQAARKETETHGERYDEVC